MQTLAALITRNQTAELSEYLNLALDNGVKPSEISEMVTHLAFYSGLGECDGGGYGSEGGVPDVAIFYRHDGERIPAPGLIVIGKIKAGVEALSVRGAISATIERL